MAIDTAEGECIGKTWSSRLKESKPRDTIRCLKDPVTGAPTRNSGEMVEIAARYHEQIQLADRNPQDPPDKPKLDKILGRIRAKLPAPDKDKLLELISEREVRNVIRKTSNDKAPGLDDIPIELWKSLDDQYLASKDAPTHRQKCNIVYILT